VRPLVPDRLRTRAEARFDGSPPCLLELVFDPDEFRHNGIRVEHRVDARQSPSFRFADGTDVEKEEPWTDFVYGLCAGP